MLSTHDYYSYFYILSASRPVGAGLSIQSM